jgi:hypothetical protein
VPALQVTATWEDDELAGTVNFLQHSFGEALEAACSRVISILGRRAVPRRRTEQAIVYHGLSLAKTWCIGRLVLCRCISS